MTALHRTRSSLPAHGHRSMISPVPRGPFTEAAKANHLRRLKLALERMERHG